MGDVVTFRNVKFIFHFKFEILDPNFELNSNFATSLNEPPSAYC